MLLPADHYVRDEDVLNRALLQALERVERNADRPVLLGLQPDEPDTELGYILPGGVDPFGGHSVARFIEKPGYSVAREIIEAGGLCNTFIMVAAARTLLDLYMPRYAPLVMEMQVSLAKGRTAGSPTGSWPALARVCTTAYPSSIFPAICSKAAPPTCACCACRPAAGATWARPAASVRSSSCCRAKAPRDSRGPSQSRRSARSLHEYECPTRSPPSGPVNLFRKALRGTARASTSPCSPSMRKASSCACSMTAAAASCSASRCASRPTRSGIATCPKRDPASCMAIACTARTSRSTGIASIRNKLLLDPYAKAIVGSLAWSDAHFGYRIGSQRARPVARSAQQRERHAEVPGDRSGVLVGRRPQPAHAVARHGHLRDARARLHASCTRRCRRSYRGTYAALAHDAGHRVPASASASRRSS